MLFPIPPSCPLLVLQNGSGISITSHLTPSHPIPRYLHPAVSLQPLSICAYQTAAAAAINIRPLRPAAVHRHRTAQSRRVWLRASSSSSWSSRENRLEQSRAAPSPTMTTTGIRARRNWVCISSPTSLRTRHKQEKGGMRPAPNLFNPVQVQVQVQPAVEAKERSETWEAKKPESKFFFRGRGKWILQSGRRSIYTSLGGRAPRLRDPFPFSLFLRGGGCVPTYLSVYPSVCVARIRRDR
ncbi:hypothetical protein QBC39DRAFT_149235 [Podospora conica]|nr:hypothetical protein QBC39DRAFT_149235 [Schizothecium conicum]